MTLYLGTSRRFAYKVSRVITDEQTCLGQALTKLVHMKSQVNHNRKLFEFLLHKGKVNAETI